MNDIQIPHWMTNANSPRPCNCSKPMDNGEEIYLVKWDDGTMSECHESCLVEVDG